MSSVVQEKSEEFALRIIKLYQYMTTREQNREYVLSKQLLRSGTSIGANIAEAEFGISKDDFKAKMYIALKECNESRYWLRLLNRASYLSNEEFDSIYEDFALRVPPFHFCGTMRLTLTVPLISELWYRYRASEMNAVKRCSVTDAP